MHQQNNIEKVYLLIKVFATSHNKAYPLRSEYLAWPAAHCGKKPPQRRVSKTLNNIRHGRPGFIFINRVKLLAVIILNLRNKLVLKKIF